MTRAVIQGLVLFLLPFVLFALYLIFRRRNPWSGRIGAISRSGLSL